MLIACCGALQSFEVFAAQSEAELCDRVMGGETAWCGLDRLLSGHKSKCSIKVSPFQTTHIGVVPTQGIKLFKSGTAVHPELGLACWTVCGHPLM